MDGTERELNQRWATWLQGMLDQQRPKKWTGADLRRALDARGTTIGPSQVSRWLNAEQRASVKSAGLIADVFGVDRRIAFDAAGRLGEVGDDEGPITVIADPADVYIARIKARGLPPAIEAGLIEYVRNEIGRRDRAMEELIDTVAATQALPAPDSEPDAD